MQAGRLQLGRGRWLDQATVWRVLKRHGLNRLKLDGPPHGSGDSPL